MSVTLHLLLATAVIAAMIGLRIVATRDSHSAGECGKIGCCRGQNVDDEPCERTPRGA